jgi:DNA-binding response OmpR family regulator
LASLGSARKICLYKALASELAARASRLYLWSVARADDSGVSAEAAASALPAGTIFSFPPFRLDADNEQLWKGERCIALQPRTLAVLRYLLERPQRLVTKEQLLDDLWGGVHVGDAVLKTHLREIRSALGDDVKTPRFIETAHRRGYRFIARVEQAVRPRPTPAPMPAQEPQLVRDAFVAGTPPLEGLERTPRSDGPILKVVVVDDHEFMRDGLRLFLDNLRIGAHTQTVGSCGELVALLANQSFDLVLLDWQLPDATGVQTLARINDRTAPPKVIVISADDSAATARQALRCGAAGFVRKAAASQVLSAAIQLVTVGERYVPSHLLDLLHEGTARAPQWPR